MLKRSIIVFFSFFLVSNLVVRLYALHGHGVVLKWLLPTLAVIGLLAWGRSAFIKICFFFFGLSLPLYGFQSYTFYNHVFEFILVFLSCILLFSRGHLRLMPLGIGGGNGLVGSYLLLALFSLLLFPLSSFIDTLSLWGVFDFCHAFFHATPEDPLYAIAAVNRLLLFVLFIVLINRNSMGDTFYRMLFLGCGCSVILACLLGLLNQYGIISLGWYRPEFHDISGVRRLHSVFGNPGWFAEYVLVCTPFVLFLFSRKTGGTVRVLIFSTIFICVGIALLLTGSRTGWLIFPILTFFCCLALLLFHGDKERAIAWKEVKQPCLQVGGVALLVCLAVGAVFMGVGRERSMGDQKENLSRQQYILQRIQNVANPSVRLQLWRESLVLAGESSVFGLGYEGYSWHQRVMSSVPASRFSQQRETSNNWDTAHNFYIQLLASNGVAGLLLWLLLTAYVAFLLCRDAIRNRNVQSFALLGALSAFHLYGFTQSMQYVASVYFLVFVIIGYAMRLESQIKIPGIGKIGKYGTLAAFLAAVTGGVVYASNLQSRNLADRYALSYYGTDRTDTRYKGFYQKEDWGEDGFFRWSGRAAEIVLSGSGGVQFDFACYAPRLEQLPITVAVMMDGRRIDRYTFRKPQKVTRTYFIPVQDRSSPTTLHLQLSRVWNPKREKVSSDTRNLAIAVSEPRYVSLLPAIPSLLLR